MKRMSHAQTKHFMVRFREFWTIADIAKMLDVSRPTVNSWEEGRTAAPEFMIKRFEKALSELAKELHHRADEDVHRSYLHGFADAIIADKPPKWTKPAIRQYDRQDLIDVLASMLVGRRRDTASIFKKTDPMGFSRPYVYRVAEEIGVVKNHVKQGRGGHSIWTIPMRSK